MQLQNAHFAAALAAGQSRKTALLTGWKTSPAADLDADCLYWLLFLHGHDAVNARPEHTAQILKDWNVPHKVLRIQAAGDWPPLPRRNHAVLPWFLALFPKYKEAATLAQWRPPSWLDARSGQNHG